jgi:hypothetical protein
VKRAALTILSLFGALCLHTLHAPDAEAADSANDCVRMHEGTSGDGLTLSIDNNCDRRLTCSLSWTLQCESATGKVTRRAKDSTRLLVGASASQVTNASAKSCGDNWRIEDVSWDCVPSK